MPRPLAWIASIGALVFLIAAAWMGRLDQAGPAHGDLWLEGGIPATLYLPAEGEGRRAFLDPPPPDERPPGVVLMHGFASDRLGLSTLARRLAGRGYAVLTFDAAGHGQNRNPFPRGRLRADAFFGDLRTAVDHLRSAPYVDGSRIAVVGHSMGAGASLDFASRDAGIGATVLISGGWTHHGPQRPPNVLFIYAAGDPPALKQRSDELAAQLAGTDLAPGSGHGDASRGDAVRVAQVDGVDHATIVWSGDAAREIASWLDAAFGRAASTAGAGVAPDPRLRVAALLALSLLAVLPGLGWGIGRLVPRVPEPSAASVPRALLWLVGALLVAMPLVAVDTPAALLSVEVGDVLVGHFALAGLLLLVAAALRGEAPLSPLRVAGPRILAVAGLGVVALHVLMLPLGAVVHRLSLTPERALVFAGATAGLLPLSLCFQRLLRRGPPLRAALASAAGRVLLLCALLLGVSWGVLSFVVVLMLPSLVLVFVLIELLAGSIYAASRNQGVIAWIDAAWLALVIAAAMPIRL